MRVWTDNEIRISDICNSNSERFRLIYRSENQEGSLEVTFGGRERSVKVHILLNTYK